MKKFLLLFILFPTLLFAQSGRQAVNFTTATSSIAIPLIGTAVVNHQLTWNDNGTVSACTVALDSSADGVTWTAGGAITGQTCTSNGQSAIVNSNVNYVRITVTALTGGGNVTVTWTGSGTNSGGGSQPIAPNQVNYYLSPNCGTQTNCFPVSTTSPDNSTNFTTAFTAINAATTSVYPVSPRTAPSTAGNSAANSHVTVNAINQIGDTTYVFPAFSSGTPTFTDSTSGTNTYSQVFAGNPFDIYQSVTTAQFSSVTVTLGSTQDVSAAVITLPGVASHGASLTTSTGTNTTPAVTLTGVPANSNVLAECQWASAGAVTLSSTSGTLRTNLASGAAQIGLTVWSTFTAAGGSITSGGTLSGSPTAWNCAAFYVSGPGTTAAYPIVDLARGYYYYSGGISMNIPMVLKCEYGAILDYTGTGKAVDINPPTGFLSNGLVVPATIVDGCVFTDGFQMANGIVVEQGVTATGFRNNIFWDFGNASSYMISEVGENWDSEIGPQNRFVIDDGLGRKIFQNNSGATSFNSFARIHDNQAVCQAPGVAGGCSTSSGTGVAGFTIDGLHSMFYHNNIAFFDPDVWLRCSNSPCAGNEITDNQMEGTGVAPITFSTGVDRALINHNVAWLHGLSSFVAPETGTDKLIGSLIESNQVGEISSGTPVVALNNLTGQTTNQSMQNECSIGATTTTPHVICPIPHTTGSNISPFGSNNDDLHQSYGYLSNGTTFTASGCGNTTLTGGATAGKYTSVTAGSCSITITMGNALAATNGWSCWANDITTSGDAGNIHQTGGSTTTAILTEGTVAANDVINFGCLAY